MLVPALEIVHLSCAPVVDPRGESLGGDSALGIARGRGSGDAGKIKSRGLCSLAHPEDQVRVPGWSVDGHIFKTNSKTGAMVPKGLFATLPPLPFRGKRPGPLGFRMA